MTAALQLGLGGPADLIGGLAKIAAGDEEDFAGDGWDGGYDHGDGIGGHFFSLCVSLQSHSFRKERGMNEQYGPSASCQRASCFQTLVRSMRRQDPSPGCGA